MPTPPAPRVIRASSTRSSTVSVGQSPGHRQYSRVRRVLPQARELLASSNPKSPYYLNPTQLVRDHDELNDMNAIKAGTAHWRPALLAANDAVDPTAWPIAWSYGVIGDHTGMTVYSGLDADAFPTNEVLNNDRKELALGSWRRHSSRHLPLALRSVASGRRRRRIRTRIVRSPSGCRDIGHTDASRSYLKTSDALENHRADPDSLGPGARHRRRDEWLSLFRSSCERRRYRAGHPVSRPAYSSTECRRAAIPFSWQRRTAVGRDFSCSPLRVIRSCMNQTNSIC